MRNRATLTNRLVLTTSQFSWTVTVTDGSRKHTFHLPNSVGVGRNATGSTPNWFVNALRDMRDTAKFPHLHEAMPMLVNLLREAALDPSNLSRNKMWGDIELRLYNVAKVAREGRSYDDDTLARTYDVPVADRRRLHVNNATVVRGLDNVNFDLTDEIVCDECYIVKPCSC